MIFLFRFDTVELQVTPDLITSTQLDRRCW